MHVHVCATSHAAAPDTSAHAYRSNSQRWPRHGATSCSSSGRTRRAGGRRCRLGCCGGVVVRVSTRCVRPARAPTFARCAPGAAVRLGRVHVCACGRAPGLHRLTPLLAYAAQPRLISLQLSLYRRRLSLRRGRRRSCSSGCNLLRPHGRLGTCSELRLMVTLRRRATRVAAALLRALQALAHE